MDSYGTIAVNDNGNDNASVTAQPPESEGLPVGKYAIGVDYGTESGRAVLVDVADGRQLATSVTPYRSGVIDERLPAPHQDVVLPPDWALQDADDYLDVLKTAVPAVIREAGVDPADIIGIGVDVT